MNQSNITYGIIGTVLGLVIGFFGANYLNRNTTVQANPNLPAQAAPANPNPGQPQMPQVANGGTGGAMIPEVQEAIDKAKNEPANFDAQFEMGMMYYKIRKFDEALKYLTIANGLKPEDFETKVTLGNIYFDAGKFAEAGNLYEKALEQKPGDVNLRSDYGLTFFFREPRDIDRAIAEYHKGLAIDPKRELLLQNLCGALKEKGDKPALTEAIKKLEEVNPKNQALPKLKDEL